MVTKEQLKGISLIYLILNNNNNNNNNNKLYLHVRIFSLQANWGHDNLKIYFNTKTQPCLVLFFHLKTTFRAGSPGFLKPKTTMQSKFKIHN